MNKTLFILLTIICNQFSHSQTKLPSFFGDHMVFQRNSNASVWGMDTPNTQVTIRSGWGEQKSITSDESGKWMMSIQTPGAGGPFEFTITGSTEIVLKNVMVGEVWFCSGQSNMEMPVKGFKNQPVNDSNEAILNSTNHKLRLFSVKRSSSAIPLQNVIGNWSEAKPNTVAGFSATAYFFGKKLQEVLDVPVGLIESSWGGTNIKSWMDEETLAKFDIPVFKSNETNTSSDKFPARLYNGMVHPLIDFTIAGVIWYQGESNRKEPSLYKKLFPEMINLWRSKWKRKDLPFYFVQIAPYEYANRAKDKELGINAAFLREAQSHTFQNVQNTGMVVTMDIGDCNFIHPREKKMIGDRLAYWALGHTYKNEEIYFDSPVYKDFEIDKHGKVIVTFRNSANGFSTFGKKLMGFTIAGEDRVFHKAQALINNNTTITVWTDKVESPKAVRYAFENCPEATLFTTAGLPVSSFRTDDWDR